MATSTQLKTLELPNPDGTPLPEMRIQCRAIFDRRDEVIGCLDLETADNYRRKAAAIEQFVGNRQGRDDARRAARVLECAVGAALGNSDPRGGRPKKNPPRVVGFKEIGEQDRGRFRLMHQYREVWESLLVRRGLSRSQVLRMIDRRRCKKQPSPESTGPPESLQVFDVWEFPKSEGNTAFFGAMPPQVVENLLWFYTDPGDIVVDPFAGSGTTIDVAKRMDRRIWASDLNPSTPTLPIQQHDMTRGWPKDAPARARLILLDPPYWKQAAGRYSTDPADLSNMSLGAFREAWSAIVGSCVDHLDRTGRLAFIVSPAHHADASVDLAFLMYRACVDQGLHPERRYIVPYQTQQANGQQLTWAREHRRCLHRYRDLVVFGR